MSDARFGPFDPGVRLTDREWSALEALRSSFSTAAASAQLGVAEQTFRLTLANVAEKLRVVSLL